MANDVIIWVTRGFPFQRGELRYSVHVTGLFGSMERGLDVRQKKKKASPTLDR